METKTPVATAFETNAPKAVAPNSGANGNYMDQPAALAERISVLTWYHTIDLGNGLESPGIYDHRPYLDSYGFPEDLDGQSVLDIGAASGFFSFEFERRGASVTATELPGWFEHDFSPVYQPDHTADSGQQYLDEPMALAIDLLDSQVERKFLTIYDISPESVGLFDLVFSGSVLIHLTDPARALWNIASVTRHKAIITTVVTPNNPGMPYATFEGDNRGDAWWVPSRSCLELMAVAAGFRGVEWFSEFPLDYSDGSPGPYHGVLHAYKGDEGWSANTRSADEIRQSYADARYDTPSATQDNSEVAAFQAEIERLTQLVQGYEQGRLMRLMRWFHGRRQQWLGN